MLRLLKPAAVLGLLLLALPALQAQREKLPPDDLAWVEKNFPNANKTNTGIRYVIQQEGSGQPPVPGDMVSVIYEGRLLDGQVFDQNSDREHPFQFRVGRDMVIQGWDQVLQLMKPGERRLVIIPPELGYGSRGHGRIPRDATLVFVIELVGIQRE